MAYRQTFVIEYPSMRDAPRVGAGMKMLGGDLFDDALEEIEARHSETKPPASRWGSTVASSCSGCAQAR